MAIKIPKTKGNAESSRLEELSGRLARLERRASDRAWKAMVVLFIVGNMFRGGEVGPVSAISYGLAAIMALVVCVEWLQSTRDEPE